MKTYEFCAKKRKVQELLWSEIGYYPSHVVALLGPISPATEEYIQLIKRVSGEGDIFSYEKDSQVEQKLGINKNGIYIIKKDVFYAESRKIMDLDLMRTILSEEYLLKHLFENQKEKFQYDKKFFMFTICTRGLYGLVSVQEFLNNLLNVPIDYTGVKENLHGELKGIRKYNFIASSRYKISAYGYRDTTNMLSVLIQYN